MVSTRSQSEKQGTVPNSKRLPQSEIESLRQEAKENTSKMRALLEKRNQVKAKK
jgi:hypothetical protein